MPEHRKLIMKVAILFLLLVVLAGCGTPSVAQSTTPTSQSVPMVRVTVQLVDVVCDHKQNAFGYHDSFYMMTAFAAPQANPQARPVTQAQLSLPLDITSGQDLELPQSHLLVFDGLVPLHGSARGGFTAYNDKHGLTWNSIDLWVAKIAKSVGDKLFEDSIDSAELGAIAAFAIIDIGVNVWYALAGLTKDNSNQLGKLNLDIPASGPPSEDGVLHFYNAGGWFGVNGWDYTVKYHVTRTPVTR